MKKLIVVLLILTSSLFSIFAIPQEFTPRIWAFNGEQNISIDLSKTFYLPKYSTIWDSKPSLENGTYKTKIGTNGNGIGNIGVTSMEDHRIQFTLTTTGKFVSQSDPTKYRDFYVAVKPRVRKFTGGPGNWDKGTDLNYYSDDGVTARDSESRVPNTRANGHSVSVTTPYTYCLVDSNNNVQTGAGYEYKLIANTEEGSVYGSRVYYDILLGLDPITSQDMIHLHDADDYIAQVEISWHCTKAGCTEDHSGGYVFTIRGYYNEGGNTSDNVFMMINPTAEATRIDISNMINPSINPSGIGQQQIATMNVLTTNVTKANWVKNVVVFLSASPNPSVADAKGFTLERYYPSGGKEIPFTIKVYNEGYDGASFNRIFTGTERYQDYNSSKNMFLNLAGNMIYYDAQDNPYTVDINQALINRSGQATSAMSYTGNVVVEINDSTHAIYNDLASYTGLYKENIYYHIIYAN